MYTLAFRVLVVCGFGFRLHEMCEVTPYMEATTKCHGISFMYYTLQCYITYIPRCGTYDLLYHILCTTLVVEIKSAALWYTSDIRYNLIIYKEWKGVFTCEKSGRVASNSTIKFICVVNNRCWCLIIASSDGLSLMRTT